MNQIKDVVIVGGGTAGLIAALYLKKTYPNYNILVVKSSSIGIIGVGEGSTEHWNNFMNHCDLNFKEVINETDATVKIGILFNDWSHPGSSYSHSVLSELFKTLSATSINYENKILNGKGNISYLLSSPEFEDTILKNKVFIYNDLQISNQYHFDTFKLNDYLIKKCILRDIKIKECLVQDITQDISGNITSLITEDGQILNGDFFIDASGFKRVLSSKLGTKWKSYKDYLPMNQAITLSTDLDYSQGIEPYTKTTALSSGWAWKIPTQTRYGNGYVFNNKYLDADNALNEFNQHLGTNIEKFAKNIKFETGKVDKFWIKNCVSIGLAGSFAEPLEAQSIGFSILQSQLLSNLLIGWQVDNNISSKYNDTLNQTWDNIVSYVQIHYLTQRRDSKFWQDKPFKLTDFNQSTKKRFSHGIFLNQDFPDKVYHMFNEPNFFQVYYGIGLITKNNIKARIKNHPPYYLDHLSNLPPENSLGPKITHVDYLKLIRENYSS